MSDLIRIVPLAARHRADWERLYAGYAEFYRVTQTPEMRSTVWGWIMDPAHEVNALVAEDAAGRAVGLAHYRPFARPLSASTGCFLDDLFVAPETRGQRVGEALIEALAALARERGWSVVNVDAVVVAERPKLRPHIGAMQAAIAARLGLEPERVGVKATTNERLGPTGREEGIACHAVALLTRP